MIGKRVHHAACTDRSDPCTPQVRRVRLPAGAAHPDVLARGGAGGGELLGEGVVDAAGRVVAHGFGSGGDAVEQAGGGAVGDEVAVEVRVGLLVGGAEPVVREEPLLEGCLLYTSPSPRDRTRSRMPSSA